MPMCAIKHPPHLTTHTPHCKSQPVIQKIIYQLLPNKVREFQCLEKGTRTCSRGLRNTHENMSKQGKHPKGTI